jgi:hypothetical protein
MAGYLRGSARKTFELTLGAAALLIPALGMRETGIAASGGAFPGFTGAPGEETCRHCHDTFPLNVGDQALRVEGFPETYSPGAIYPVTVSLTSPSGVRWGFQATSVAANSRKGAGRFRATDKAHTKVVEGYFEPSRRYVEQKRAGTYPGQRDGASWSFEWKAPKRDKGPITLYVAGNVSNDNGDRTGDFIYYTEVTSQPAE